MNERIKELARDAGFTSNDDQEVFLRVYEQELKKFAELIVRECMDVSMLPESGCDNWNYLHLSPAEAIAKHFGIE